jgi:hypothetical protein
MAHERNVFADFEKFHGRLSLIGFGFGNHILGDGVGLPHRANGDGLQTFLSAIPKIDQTT